MKSQRWVGAGGQPAHAPLRTVRESFPSHGSSLSKAGLVRADPLHDGNRGILRTHRNPFGQLGNTGGWPFSLRAMGRQLRDAPSDWRRSSFAFPDWRRFHILSCHSTPGRRGHIRRATHRPWLLRPSQCCVFLPCLTVGATTTRVAHGRSFSMFCIRYRMDLGPLCYTGSPVSARRATFDDPDSTACPFGSSLEQPRMAGFSVTMLTSVQLI